MLTKFGANADWPCKVDLDEDDLEEHAEECKYPVSTVLIIAVRKQDLSMVRLLLQHGANVNKAEVVFGKGNSDEDEDDHYLFEPLEDSGKLDTTPLSVALETKNVAIIELIRSKGAKGEWERSGE